MANNVAPMRLQLKINDGTDEGRWVTFFAGWADLPGSGIIIDHAMAELKTIEDKEQKPIVRGAEEEIAPVATEND